MDQGKRLGAGCLTRRGRVLALVSVLVIPSGCTQALKDNLDAFGENLNESLKDVGGKPDTTAERQAQINKILAGDRPNKAILAAEALRAAPHKDYPDLTVDMEARAYRLPSVMLYELASRIYPHDRWRGVFWYFAARVRYTYDLMRCVDPTVSTRLEGADRFANGPVTEIRLKPNLAYAVALAALRWDRETDLPPDTLIGECASGESFQFAYNQSAVIRTSWPYDSPYMTMEKPYKLHADEWIKPLIEHKELLEKARRRVHAEVDRLPGATVELPEEWQD